MAPTGRRTPNSHPRRVHTMASSLMSIVMSLATPAAAHTVSGVHHQDAKTPTETETETTRTLHRSSFNTPPRNPKPNPHRHSPNPNPNPNPNPHRRPSTLHDTTHDDTSPMHASPPSKASLKRRLASNTSVRRNVSLSPEEAAEPALRIAYAKLCLGELDAEEFDHMVQIHHRFRRSMEEEEENETEEKTEAKVEMIKEGGHGKDDANPPSEDAPASNQRRSKVPRHDAPGDTQPSDVGSRTPDLPDNHDATDEPTAHSPTPPKALTTTPASTTHPLTDPHSNPNPNPNPHPNPDAIPFSIQWTTEHGFGFSLRGEYYGEAGWRHRFVDVVQDGPAAKAGVHDGCFLVKIGPTDTQQCSGGRVARMIAQSKKTGLVGMYSTMTLVGSPRGRAQVGFTTSSHTRNAVPSDSITSAPPWTAKTRRQWTAARRRAALSKKNKVTPASPRLSPKVLVRRHHGSSSSNSGGGGGGGGGASAAAASSGTTATSRSSSGSPSTQRRSWRIGSPLLGRRAKSPSPKSARKVSRDGLPVAVTPPEYTDPSNVGGGRDTKAADGAGHANKDVMSTATSTLHNDGD
eukprot:m.125779 g.125779  ORF g.125779 m.125779 type:complete len:575 (+) comp11176_c4_seq4:76-1800(+)